MLVACAVPAVAPADTAVPSGTAVGPAGGKGRLGRKVEAVAVVVWDDVDDAESDLLHLPHQHH